ncbi:hypothetical protein [Peterkaempfera bronchialis]|uniref:hypothetical protein n=1 Tax=Peterkaempfera bronchialis TaxID=2126346 RepID=UPI003C2B1DAF
MRQQGQFRWRTRLRRRLPWFLIERGIAAKGAADCGAHEWYNHDGAIARCYHCEADEVPYAPRRALFLRDGLSSQEVVLAHREALRILRADIDAAYVDAYSDEPWPPEVLPFYEQALCIGAGREAGGFDYDPGMGIEVDVRDDAQFDLLVALAPYSIHVEGWSRGSVVYSANDTGTGLCVMLTASQETDLVTRLVALGMTSPLYARG